MMGFVDLLPFLSSGEKLRAEQEGTTCRAVAHRLPPGWTGTLHVHPESDEVFVFLSGEGRLEVGGQTREIRSPALVLVPRGVRHNLAVSADGGMTLVTAMSLPR